MESDSAQANTARSQTNFFRFSNIFISREFRIHMIIFQKIRIFFKNPKLANTARSRTLHRLTLHGVQKIFKDFWKSPVPGNFGSRWWYLEKFHIFFENSKLANTARSRQLNFLKIQKWLTLRGVLPSTILSVQASPCL